MKVLLISNTFPADPDSAVHGIYQRLDTFVKALRGHKLTALFFVPADTDTSKAGVEAARSRLADEWEVDLDIELCTRAAPASGRWEAYVEGIFSLSGQSRYRLTSGRDQIAAVRRRIRESPDAIFVHRLTAMSPLLELPRPGVPTFFDLDDVEHVAFERRLRVRPPGPGRRLLRLQLTALRRGERRAIDRSNLTFVCSDADRDYLRGLYGTQAVETIPNSVQIPPDEAVGGQQDENPRVLFLGNYAHPPNRRAADRLADLWPAVSAQVPRARLVLAGPEPDRLTCYASGMEGLEFPGFVDDLGDLYRKTTAVCAPIDEGGGTRIKLLEAGAWARPIVATNIAAEGIGFDDGVHFIRREENAGLAEACVELLRDEEKSRRLGTAARRLVRERYSREAVIHRVRDLFAANGLARASAASQG